MHRCSTIARCCSSVSAGELLPSVWRGLSNRVISQGAKCPQHIVGPRMGIAGGPRRERSLPGECIRASVAVATRGRTRGRPASDVRGFASDTKLAGRTVRALRCNGKAGASRLCVPREDPGNEDGGDAGNEAFRGTDARSKVALAAVIAMAFGAVVSRAPLAAVGRSMTFGTALAAGNHHLFIITAPPSCRQPA